MEKFEPQKYRDDLAEELTELRSDGEQGRDIAKEKFEALKRSSYDYRLAKISRLPEAELAEKFTEGFERGDLGMALDYAQFLPEPKRTESIRDLFNLAIEEKKYNSLLTAENAADLMEEPARKNCLSLVLDMAVKEGSVEDALSLAGMLEIPLTKDQLEALLISQITVHKAEWHSRSLHRIQHLLGRKLTAEEEAAIKDNSVYWTEANEKGEKQSEQWHKDHTDPGAGYP